MTHKAICVRCETSYRPRKNDIRVLETMDGERPYRIWCADLWECPSCGQQIIAGFGALHIAEHYEEDFAEQAEKCFYTFDGTPRSLIS